MGLALDEPKDGDERHEIGGLEIFLDRLSSQAGPISIDYVSHPYYGGFQVKSGEGSSCC